MTDLIDQANDLAEAERTEALARHHAEVERQRRVAESLRPHDPAAPLMCLECGDPIDPRRVAALPLTNRCTECAQAYERAMRGGCR